MTGTAEAVLRQRELEPHERGALMHRVRMVRTGGLVDSATLKHWLESSASPSPAEQINNLVLWLAGKLRYAGERVDLAFDAFQAIVGAASGDGFTWVVGHAKDQGLIEGAKANAAGAPIRLIHATLTPKGWQLADELRRTERNSRIAFVAMKFGDEQTDALYRDILAPAIRQAGFEPRRLDIEQPAGLIDDQLRVAIRRSRLVLADLTHGNRGAYWEAGFAEGLGKPVIYLCRRDVFESTDAAVRPHFDTSHMVTIMWDPDDLTTAGTRLKACIRASLPGEAIMSNGPDGLAQGS